MINLIGSDDFYGTLGNVSLTTLVDVSFGLSQPYKDHILNWLMHLF